MIIGIAVDGPNIASNIVLVKEIETIPNLIKQARKYIKTIDTSIILATIIKPTTMILGLIGTIYCFSSNLRKGGMPTYHTTMANNRNRRRWSNTNSPNHNNNNTG